MLSTITRVSVSTYTGTCQKFHLAKNTQVMACEKSTVITPGYEVQITGSLKYILKDIFTKNQCHQTNFRSCSNKWANLGHWVLLLF